MEVGTLTLGAVLAAAQMASPQLRLRTAKKRRSTDRLVPISAVDLRQLLDFIRFSRSAVVRKLRGAGGDDGFFFVSERTGVGMSIESISSEISKLRAAAGIDQQTCAHMFRHRAITKYFIHLIARHDLKNSIDVKRAVLDIEGLKQQVIELTGQSSTKSLDHYIDLAFRESGDLPTLMDAEAVAARDIEAIRRELADFRTKASKGTARVADIKRLDSALADLERSHPNKPRKGKT